MTNSDMSLDFINKRICKEICFDTINALKDENLMNDYKKCNSVKIKINTIDMILKKHDIDKEKRLSIINEYLLELIPAGTKGVIRGNLFNNIVKKTIEEMNLDKDKFEICFEKKMSFTPNK